MNDEAEKIDSLNAWLMDMVGDEAVTINAQLAALTGKVSRLAAIERRQRQILLVALVASSLTIILVLLEAARIMGWLP